MKWVLLAISVAVFLFPIKATASVFYEQGQSTFFFNLYIYGIRVLNGKTSLVNGNTEIGFLFFKKQLNISEVYNNKGKLRLYKGLSLLELSFYVKCNGENSAINLFAVNSIDNVVSAIKPVIKSKNPFFKSKNICVIDFCEKHLSAAVFISVGFNIAIISVLFLLKIVKGVINGKRKKA